MQKFPRFVAGWGVEASRAEVLLRRVSYHVAYRVARVVMGLLPGGVTGIRRVLISYYWTGPSVCATKEHG